MSQPRTLLVVIVALLLLMGAGFAQAQAAQCRGDGEAVSVLLTDDNGEPATARQIEDTFRSTIGVADIIDCLRAGDPLVNHVIDYGDYASALGSFRIGEDQDQRSPLVIKDSVLWSPNAGTVELGPLVEDWVEGDRGRSIQWTGVVLGPGVSGRDTVFNGAINLRGATLHGQANFIGADFARVDFTDAIFNGIARFYSGTSFNEPASFRGVQFRGEAYFHDKTTFHENTSFAGATFDGNAYNYREKTGEAYFHDGTTFLDGVDFERATFNVKPHFSADTFKSSVSFSDADFRVKAPFHGVLFPGDTSFRNTRFDKGASFEKAVFNMGASFQKAEFRQRTTFIGAQFRLYADFNDVSFVNGATVFFSGSIFDGEADFGGARFTGVPRFQRVQFNMGVSFKKAVFNRQAIFARARFRQYAEFDDVQFAEGAKVSFTGSIFDVKAAFKGDTFPGPTWFQDAQFNMDASFQKAVFYQQANFSGAQFRQRADFDDVRFVLGTNASFARSIFDGEAAFGGTRFTGPAEFQRVQFNMGASFQKAVFYQQANFENAVFGGDLSFREAIIRERLRLVDATWEGRADFRKSVIVELDWDSENRPSTVKGVFDAREAELKSLTIKDVYFSDLADFSGATFGKAASATEDKILSFDLANLSGGFFGKAASAAEDKILFEDVIFERAADFLRANFHAEAIFVKNRFRGLLDFTNAPFAEHARLCLLDNRIGQLLMDREHLSTTQAWQLFRKLSANLLLEESRFRAVNVKTSETDATYSCAEPNQPDSDHEHLQKIYGSIESSFRNANDRWGENEAWYLGTVANRKAGDWLWKVVHVAFLDFPSRYGIDYVRALAVSVFCVLLFWAVYWLYFRCVFVKTCQYLPHIMLAAPPEQRRALRFRPFERLFHPTVREKRPLHPWQDALFLSCRAFFKLGLGSSYPPVLACLVYFEWVVGMYMLIHFLFVLKNTLPIALPFLSG